MIRKSEFEKFAADNGMILVDHDIKVGDLYIAGRNNGIDLYEAREIGNGCIFAKGTKQKPMPYPYDFRECWKVTYE